MEQPISLDTVAVTRNMSLGRSRRLFRDLVYTLLTIRTMFVLVWSSLLGSDASDQTEPLKEPLNDEYKVVQR
jgi:hypothetical protein